MLLPVRAMAVVVTVAGYFVSAAAAVLYFSGSATAHAAAGRWAGVPTAVIGLLATLWVTGPAIVAGWRPIDARDGRPVERGEQPRLWELLDRVSDAVGADRVATLRLVSGSEITARADGGLLGLRPGPLRLRVGFAVLVAFDVAEFAAVLASHLAGHTRRQGAVAAIAARSEVPVQEASQRIRGLPHSGYLLIWRRLYRWCSRGMVAAHRRMTVARAAEVFGHPAIDAAIRREQTVARLWREFTLQYRDPARAAGVRADPVEGFRCMLDAHGAAPTTAATSLLDGSPRSLHDAVEPPPHGCGATPLTWPQALVTRPQALVTRPQALVTRPQALVTWPQALSAVAAAQVARRAARTADIAEKLGLADESTVEAVLLMLQAGVFDPATRTLFEAATTEDPAPDLRLLIHAVFADAARSTGRAGFTTSWTGPPRLLLDGRCFDLEAQIDTALDDPETAIALRHTVTELAIPLGYRPVPPPRTNELPAAVLGTVKVDGHRSDLAVFGWGLLALPQRWRWRPSWMLDAWLEQRRLDELATRPAARLARGPGARVLPTADIVSVSLPHLPTGRTTLTLDDGTRVTLRLRLTHADQVDMLSSVLLPTGTGRS